MLKRGKRINLNFWDRAYIPINIVQIVLHRSSVVSPLTISNNSPSDNQGSENTYAKIYWVLIIPKRGRPFTIISIVLGLREQCVT
jgi:hypothetical protein